MKRSSLLKLFIILFSISNFSCDKNFLDAKPSSSIVNPITIDELNQLMENEPILNSATPALSVLAADEYSFVGYSNWQAIQLATERNSYIWDKNLYNGETKLVDWNAGYNCIFYCNNVLEGLDRIKNPDQKQYNSVKGRALFVRAYVLFDLVRNFAPAYNQSTASTDLGLPIRLKGGIDQVFPRSSIDQTYSQIISDIIQASDLLDVNLPENRNKPSKAACYALFSRIYLSMRIYDKAEEFANKCLALHNKLIDYNTVSKTNATPFALNNDETIYSTYVVGNYQSLYASSSNTSVTISPELLSLYNSKDLRLPIFFGKTTKGNMYLKRGYYGASSYLFSGLATDEIFLIKAECLARRNELQASMDVLNELLKKRFAENDFVATLVTNQPDALSAVLLERRKELVWRSLRWTDIKRLNLEGANITLSRELNGITYTLPPNDPRYIFPIPDDEIALSGIKQNIR